MILHHLKIAIRSLLKYKTHCLISAICLSVGMTCFCIVHFYINEIDGATRRLPNFEQRIGLRIMNPNNKEDRAWGWFLTPSQIKTLTDHPIPGIKQLSCRSFESQAEVVFINQEQEEKPYIVSYISTDPNFFPHYQASFLYGNTLPVEPDEVVLSESCARKVYGEKNPVGTLLKIVQFKEEEKKKDIYYKVVNVVKELPKVLRVQADIYFSYRRDDAQQNGFIMEGVLDTPDGLDKANESLKGVPFLHRGEMTYLVASKEADSYQEPQRLMLWHSSLSYLP